MKGKSIVLHNRIHGNQAADSQQSLTMRRRGGGSSLRREC